MVFLLCPWYMVGSHALFLCRNVLKWNVSASIRHQSKTGKNDTAIKKKKGKAAEAASQGSIKKEDSEALKAEKWSQTAAE